MTWLRPSKSTDLPARSPTCVPVAERPLRRSVFEQGANFRTFLRAQAMPSGEIPLIEGLLDVASTIDGAVAEAVQWLTQRREELADS